MTGWIAMDRDALDHPLLQDADKFRAWFWLVANASWKPTRADVGGRMIELDRGQLSFSVRFLAEKWKWPKSTVDRWLKRLEIEKMVNLSCSKTGTANGTGQLIITICNYDKYQNVNGDAGTPSGTEVGQQRDKEEQGNKGTRDSISPDGDIDAPPAEDFAPAIDLRKVVFDAGMLVLSQAGIEGQRARAIIGKWRKAASDGQLIDVIARCREHHPVDPVSWINAAIVAKPQGSPNDRYRQNTPVEPANAFARAAIKRQAARAANER
jgi:hypothetical protein